MEEDDDANGPLAAGQEDGRDHGGRPPDAPLAREAELAEAKRRAEALLHDLQRSLDVMNLGVVILDCDLNTTLVNKTFFDIWKVTPRDVPIGQPFRALMDVNRHNGIYDVGDEEWEDYVAFRLDEIRQGDTAPREFRRADGFTMIYSVTSLSGGKRLVSYYDITEMKRREEALEEAQRRAVLADRAKSEFLANMSHEIRTPMNGVLGMAELLAKSDLDSRQRTFVDIIAKSGTALLTIINDILDFSKIDAGQLVLDPAPFHLAEAIEDVATLVSTRAKEKNLELIVRVQPDLHGHYVGDAGRIRQIITNLVGNAVKFTESGHVLVDVGGKDDGAGTVLRVAVTDTGIGIPQDKLGQVFDKFSQVDSSSTRRHEGTGLGLAITSRLVAMMGGEIGAESREGEGSTFWFTLRLPRAETSRKERIMPVDVSGARILVVDDNAVNRAILMEQMASWGFDACAAESGEEGIAVLRAVAALGLSVDCLVLDYQMPGMTGAEMARIVRATPQVADTPIVMLTSVDQQLGQPGYRDIAVDQHLIKPARSSALLEAVVAAIQKHRGRRVDGGATPPATAALATAAEARGAREAPPQDLRIVPRGDGRDHRVDVLVAEDNEVNQLVFTQILNETGLTYEIVGNGRLAVEACRAMNPRMILMDVSMPEMNGLEATARIRKAEAATGRRVPIVGVTAHALKGDCERCIEAGMDDYLSKPISPRALTQKIERWIGDARADGQAAG
ncbi:MAG: hypothetical protein DCC69_03415 [Hyphomicrobiales bacterium]|nr:MAG: hypothetical protein DCC69_03415 [Hyphomicrobiales bacterium]